MGMQAPSVRQVNCCRLQTVMRAATGASELVAQMSLSNCHVWPPVPIEEIEDTLLPETEESTDVNNHVSESSEYLGKDVLETR